MVDSRDEKRTYVEKLAADNREYFATERGRNELGILALPFVEHRWIYLSELVQNALDAHARKVSISVNASGDELTFQHDGSQPLGSADVKGLSEPLCSTKGAGAVGFMGIGFRSVFARFREVAVSGWGWTFRYDVKTEVGEKYGDRQPDLLGAVAPIWDERIAVPEPGYTTRFTLSKRDPSDADLNKDISQFLPHEGRAPLAILARRGLKQLSLCDELWELSINKATEQSVEAVAVSSAEKLRWQLFPVRYKPSSEAIARFLEHRKIRPEPGEEEQGHAAVEGVREVLGVVRLDEKGAPASPSKGRVYATLPTDVAAPFGFHLNADWLLNISRTALGEIEDNEWQTCIVEHVVDVVASLMTWIATSCHDPDVAKRAFCLFSAPDDESPDLLARLVAQPEWLTRLADTLRHRDVVPVWSQEGSGLRFVRPGAVVVPPEALLCAFEETPSLLPSVLMKRPVLASGVLGRGARELLEAACLLTPMTPSQLGAAWEDGLEAWWSQLPDEKPSRRDLLFRLWGAVAQLPNQEHWRTEELPCLRTNKGKWISVSKISYFSERLPSPKEPGGVEVRQLLESSGSGSDGYLMDGWVDALRQEAGKRFAGPCYIALRWLKKNGRESDLRDSLTSAVKRLAESPSPDFAILLALARWVMNLKRPNLLTYVVVDSPTGEKAVAVEDSLIADPYVHDGGTRKRLFPALPPISSSYLDATNAETSSHSEWRELFEAAGANGSLRVRELRRNQVVLKDRETVAAFLKIDDRGVSKSNNKGYSLVDFDTQPSLPESDSPESVRREIAPWIETGRDELLDKGRMMARWTYHGEHDAKGQRSRWVQRMADVKWVPCHNDGLHRPCDVLSEPDQSRENVPVADLSADLVRVLKDEGLVFAGNIPQAPPLIRLRSVGSRLDDEKLAALLREVREANLSGADKQRYEEAVAVGVKVVAA